MMTNRTLLSTTIVAFALLAQPATAKLDRKERKSAEKMFGDRVYLRIDAPATKGRHPYGVYYSPLVEVSPRGVNTDASQGASFSWYHASTTVWQARINDPMELDELDWDDDEASVQVELEGTGSANGRDTVIRFVEIQSLADFQAAFERAFSRTPLQEEHPDWPEDIRTAIAERRLVNGMSKRQAHYVVGTPERIEKSTEEGVEVEVWTLPRKGPEVGFFGFKQGDSGGAPESLRFENGQLVSASVAGTVELDLDD